VRTGMMGAKMMHIKTLVRAQPIGQRDYTGIVINACWMPLTRR